MPKKILISDLVHQSGLDYLRERGYELVFAKSQDEEEIIRCLAGCTGVIVRGAIFNERVFSSSPDLKVAVKHGVGVDNIDLAAAKKHGIRILNTPIANTVTVAEQTMLLILGCAKRFRIMQNAAIAADHDIRRRMFTDEIQGKALGLIGFGHIGSTLATMAANGFGMKVFAYDPYVKKDILPEWVSLTDDRKSIFANNDFVSLHLPDTESTRKSVGEQEFSWMKPTAFLINAARGTIVDEKALTAALENKTIAGAGLDVWDIEPPDPNNPLLQMENVVMTPHNAASSKEAMERMCLHAAIGIDDFLSGRTPEWILV